MSLPCPWDWLLIRAFSWTLQTSVKSHGVAPTERPFCSPGIIGAMRSFAGLALKGRIGLQNEDFCISDVDGALSFG